MSLLNTERATSCRACFKSYWRFQSHAIVTDAPEVLVKLKAGGKYQKFGFSFNVEKKVVHCLTFMLRIKTNGVGILDDLVE